MIKFDSKTISVKNSKKSSIPYCGIYAIYLRGNVLIGTIQKGRSITFRRVHQGHNTWSVTTVSLFDSDYKALFDREQALLWNQNIETRCCIGKRDGVETPLIIVNKMMKQEDFYLRPLAVKIGDEFMVSPDWFDTAERLEWWKGCRPDFDWANDFCSKDIEHLLSPDIEIPEGVSLSKLYEEKDIPENMEVYVIEKTYGKFLRIREKAPETEIKEETPNIDLESEEGEQRPRRRAKAARKTIKSEEEEAPAAD